MSIECPNCGKERNYYKHKNSYVTFACSCGVFETAPNAYVLKQKLKSMASTLRFRFKVRKRRKSDDRKQRT